MATKQNIPAIPLAERVRPKSLLGFYGQEHLLSEGKPIRVMMENGIITSFILWGPPGTGKTTISRLLAENSNYTFMQLNAVSSGVKEVRAVIQDAEKNLQKEIKTLLFIDEIHRFNKAQQDSLLGAIEAGIVVLIGATTENPSFEVIPPLRSRMRIFRLSTLTEKDIERIVISAKESDDFIKSLPIGDIDTAYLSYICGGDARVALNIFEAAVLHDIKKELITVDKELLENVIQQKNIIYDKAGEEHYNLVSAFIKSIRGSDPDGAIYWLARMLAGGEDPLFIARRMVVAASEDIGNASPNGLVLAEACFSAVHKIGMPEARIILAQCATYLASQPKSNAAYSAIDAALADIEKEPLHPVPIHLRNAPTTYMKNIGYGKEYLYPHSYPGHFTEQLYLPKEIENRVYYKPTELGQEKALADRLKLLWKNKKKY